MVLQPISGFRGPSLADRVWSGRRAAETLRGGGQGRLERNDFSSNRHFALSYCFDADPDAKVRTLLLEPL